MSIATRVSVFESDSAQEIQLIKSKLQDAGIESDVENAYLSFLTTPTATNMMLKVELKNEQNAFDIIDAYLQNHQK